MKNEQDKQTKKKKKKKKKKGQTGIVVPFICSKLYSNMHVQPPYFSPNHYAFLFFSIPSPPQANYFSLSFVFFHFLPSSSSFEERNLSVQFAVELQLFHVLLYGTLPETNIIEKGRTERIWPTDENTTGQNSNSMSGCSSAWQLQRPVWVYLHGS